MCRASGSNINLGNFGRSTGVDRVKSSISGSPSHRGTPYSPAVCFQATYRWLGCVDWARYQASGINHQP